MKIPIERHKKHLAYLIEKRDAAITKELPLLVAHYEQAIIATERLISTLEINRQVALNALLGTYEPTE
jgi:hypothetical protein